MSFPDSGLDALYGRVTRRLLPILLLGYVAAYLDRVNVGFAKLQMLEALHFSNTIYGLGAGLFFIGYFLFEVPSNLILHRVGARRWLARIMITWGLLSAAMMFVTTPAQLYILRFMLGAAEAGFFPGVIFYLTQWYPAARRGRVMALFMTAIALCSVIGSILSGSILQSFDGVNGWAGWQWLFLLEALPTVLIGLWIFRALPDRIGDARWLMVADRKRLAAELAREGHTAGEGVLSDAFADSRVWLACLIYFCIVMGLYGLSFWLPTIVADLGVHSPRRIGLLTAIPYAVAAIAMVLVARSSDRTGERRWHVAVPLALGSLGLIASVAASRSLPFALIALSFAALGILAAAPLFWSIPTAYLRGTGAAGGIALINSIGNLAGFISPYLVGWTKDLTGRPQRECVC